MLNRVLLIPALIAQLTDMLTLRWEIEANPLVLSLGPWAFVMKAVLLMILCISTWRVPGPAISAVLLFATVVGAYGAYTNIR